MAALDLNKLAASAFDAYLQQAKSPSNGREKKRHRLLGTGAAVAVGVGLTVAGRAAYRRIRDIDLEQAGSALEAKLKR